MKFDVRTNFPEVQKTIDETGRQARYATAVALTRTGQDVKAAEREAILGSFDRPTPYTQNSLFLKPATKTDLEARVWLKDDELTSGTPAVKYLLPEIEGGRRNTKRFEVMLQRIGILPRGWYVVPAAGAKLDAYGNISRGQIVQLLSYFQAFDSLGFSANITQKRKAAMARGTKRRRGVSYFVSQGKLREKTRHLAPGIWQRTPFGPWGDEVKPVWLFVRRVEYRQRFDFFGVGQSVVDSVFPMHFEREMTKAIETAEAKARG